MAVLLNVVEDYSPPNDQSGVPLRSTIEIQFSTLMDERSVEEAFYVEGPDTDTVIGPDSKASIWPSAFGVSLGEEPDYLSSPGYQGIVQGTFTFETVDDKTKMIFTPNQAMAALTHYVVHITDCYQNSFGDTASGVANVGNGEVEFDGSWTNTDNAVNMRVTKSGVAGIAEFVWWKDSDPLEVKGPVLTTRRGTVTLEEGLFVEFGDGTFIVDDEFSASLSTAVLCSGHLTFEFDTGSGSIVALPTTSSTSILSELRQTSASATVPLRVVRTIPSDHQAQVDPDLTEIILEFNKSLDETTITDAMIEVVSEIASSHPSLGAVAQGDLAKRLVVDGRRLKIQI